MSIVRARRPARDQARDDRERGSPRIRRASARARNPARTFRHVVPVIVLEVVRAVDCVEQRSGRSASRARGHRRRRRGCRADVDVEQQVVPSRRSAAESAISLAAAADVEHVAHGTVDRDAERRRRRRRSWRRPADAPRAPDADMAESGNDSAPAAGKRCVRIITCVLRDMLSRAARRLARGEPARLAEAAATRARGLAERGDLEAAAKELERALEIEPRAPKTWGRLANLRFELGAVDAAIAAYRRALEHDPRMPQIRSNLLFALAHRSDDPEALLAEHLAWSALVSDDGLPQSPGLRNDPDPERPLRVGYLSPDLKAHAISMFIEPLLARHDPAQVVVHCYDNAPSADEVARRLRGYGAVWREVRALDGAGFRRQVLADGIDILIDLSGHTAGNRLSALARQARHRCRRRWLGYRGDERPARRWTTCIADSVDGDPPGQTDGALQSSGYGALAALPLVLHRTRAARAANGRPRHGRPATAASLCGPCNRLAQDRRRRWSLCGPGCWLATPGSAPGARGRCGTDQHRATRLARLAGHGVALRGRRRVHRLAAARRLRSCLSRAHGRRARHRFRSPAAPPAPRRCGSRRPGRCRWSGRTAAIAAARHDPARRMPACRSCVADRRRATTWRSRRACAPPIADRLAGAASRTCRQRVPAAPAIMDEAALRSTTSKHLYRGMWRAWCGAQRDLRATP